MLRDHGQSERYRHRIEGTNGRIDAIQAGILRIKLRHLAAWNEARRAIASRYDAAFRRIEGLHVVQVLPHNSPSRHLYVIHAERRDDLRSFLRDRGIHTGLHYPVPLHLQECYRGLGIGAGAFPHAEWSAARVLSLPLFPEMAHSQIEAVIRSVEQFATAC